MSEEVNATTESDEEFTSKSLGLTPIDERTFSEDLQVGDRYQKFSEELLRLALLGFAGISFLITNVLLKSPPPESINKYFKIFVAISLICLGISSAAAILHRYFSTDSLSCHLVLLRRGIRKNNKDKKEYRKEKNKRDWLFALSGISLFISGTFLWLGAIFLALAFIFGILFP
ncbi:MAG: hypothetical protein K1X72_04195 [Pyrinomonadaceae bacterium]|nr:hypothetical protein [Pyrinomonadaceae bacterium]